MIRYLAYYSFGGYKDMMLGTDESKNDVTYYSPFLQPWRTGGMDSFDERTTHQLSQLDKLGQIEIIGYDSNYNMPQTAKTLSSHGGYMLACCKLEDGTYSVAIRNLINESKDEFGRPIPFMMQIVFHNALYADLFTEYIRKDQTKAKKMLGGLFKYNPHLNCLQFELAEANKIVQEAISFSNKSLKTNKPIRTIVITNTMSLEYSLKELGRGADAVCEAYNETGELLLQIKDAITTSRSDENFGESLLYFIDKIRHIRLAPEDKEDIKNIKNHIDNILNRHKKY